jgi:transcription initiation factor TFIIH subunit 4
VITQKGYDFMLQDNAQQVWHFVVQYLQSIESHEKATALKKEALLVLICLSFARFGESYSAASLSKDGRVIMKDLALFGLLYVKKVGKTSIFYPTRIAMQLVGSEASSSSSGGGGGMWSWSSKALDSALAHPTPHDSSHLAIIVQTNFQLCAYTTSELHVSMLGLFCDVQTIRRLPNVVFMSITRDSIKAAFTLGIQAQQILRFLEKHVHPKLRQGTNSPLPPNVVDQIYLWDRERHRVTWNEVFTHQCVMTGEFQAVQKYTMELGAHTWSSEGRNQLFIKYEYAEKVQTFVRQWRAKTAARQD